MTKAEEKQEIKRVIQNLCLMDDIFMTTFFDGEKELSEYVLRILLDKDDLVVTESKSQLNIANLYGRGGRLDILAKDSTGRIFDIEVQRLDSGAREKRARFNSALIDTRVLKAGENTENLPETYVIFITENDVLKGGKAIYHIDRIIRETETFFCDEAHIIYVNNSYRGNDSIGNLMHDFACKDTNNMKSTLLAARAKYLKENEREVEVMSTTFEQYFYKKQAEWKAQGLAEGRAEGMLQGRAEGMLQGRAEGITEGKAEAAADLIIAGKMAEDEVSVIFKFTPTQMERVRNICKQKTQNV